MTGTVTVAADRWWPGGAGDAGQDEAARVAVPVPGPARRGVLAGRRPGPRPGTGAGGISIGRAAGVPDPRQSPARAAGAAGLAGRAARPDAGSSGGWPAAPTPRASSGRQARPGGCGCRGMYSASRLELMTSSLLVLVGADVIRPSLAWLLTGGKKRKLARNMICSRDPGGFARLRQLCRDDPAHHPGRPGQGRVPVRGDHRRQGRRAGRHHHRRRAGGAGRRARRAVPGGTRARPRSGCCGRWASSGRASPTLREILRHRAAHRRGAGRPLPDRLPPGPRPDRRLPEGTPARDRLRDPRNRCPPAGQVRSGQTWNTTTPASTRCACRAMSPPRGSSGCGPGPPRPPPQPARRRRSPSSGSATSTLSPASGRSTSTWPNGRWTTRPGGARGWPRARSGPRTSSGASSPGAARPGWTPGPASGCPVLPVLARTAARSARRRPGAAGRRPPGRARPGVHRRRADPDPGRPAARRRAQRLGRRPGHRQAPPAQPRGRPRVLGLGDHRGPARSPASGSRNCSSSPTTAWSSTGCPAPASWCRCCRSPRPRPTPNGSWSSAPSSPTCLSAIICRVRGSDGAVPLVRAYDRHERIWLPTVPAAVPAPDRQRRTTRSPATSSRDLLDAALARTGLTDPAAGGPLRFTPHDFRRLFITDAILQRPAAAHRPGHRRPPGHQRHHGLQGRLPRRGHPGPPGVPRPPPGHCAPPRNTASPPTRNGKSSSATSSAARSPPAPAAARSAPPASTSTPA